MGAGDGQLGGSGGQAGSGAVETGRIMSGVTMHGACQPAAHHFAEVLN